LAPDLRVEVPFAGALDPRQLARFRREAEAAAQLHHTHIVPVHFVGCERGVHFYAMQLIPGRTLADVVAQLRGPALVAGRGAPGAPTVAAATTQRSRPDKAHFRAVARWGVQAAEALEYAHSMGVVHRDIKPANLLLDARGDVWVTDFGLAQFRADAGLTMSGDVLGTLRYMSPEQALARHGLVDHRTDVYSLGVTLYELLTLRPAFAAEDREVLLRQVASEDPPAPSRLDRAIPAELETIVLKALAKEPEARYATAGELAEDLERFLADRPIQARRPSVVQRLRKWAARHRAAVASAVGVLVLGAVAAVAGLLWHNDRLRAEGEKTALERDAAREEQRRAAQAVDDMYTEVADQWLGRQPQLQPLQRKFLEKALKYYQHAAERWGDDPAVRRKLPEAYRRAGAIHAALGRHRAAEEALRKAAAGFAEFADENPDDWAVASRATAGSCPRPGNSFVPRAGPSKPRAGACWPIPVRRWLDTRAAIGPSSRVLLFPPPGSFFFLSARRRAGGQPKPKGSGTMASGRTAGSPA
jgi:tetratricopeptide (TPR) repeat protein